MLAENAIEKYALNREECFVIGDSGVNDMMLAYNLDVKSVLVLTGTGRSSLEKDRALWKAAEPTLIVENCLEAIEQIIECYP